MLHKNKLKTSDGHKEVLQREKTTAEGDGSKMHLSCTVYDLGLSLYKC